MTVGDDGNPGSCGVNLINEGVIVNEDCARIQFTGCGPVESYLCKLDRDPFKPCEFRRIYVIFSLSFFG